MTRAEDLRLTEELAVGDDCEFRFPARREWRAGTVAVNGGSGYWRIVDRATSRSHSVYIEHVRALGTDPWS